MASSMFIPNHCVIVAPPPRISTSSKPITAAQPPPHPPLVLGFSVANSSSPIIIRNNRRRASCFISHVAPREDSVPPMNAEEDGSQNNVETSGADQPSLRALLKVYKNAIYDEDERTVSAIEARIRVIEKNQNELVQKISSMSADVTSGKEKLIRLQADFDNCRKRFEKERLTVRTDAQGEVIESLLPMVDNFERAKQQLRPESEKEKKIDASYQGIYKQFVEIMRSLRVASVPTLGKPFDPSVHEAIAREESQEFKEGIVIQELRRGFLLGGRLLRPAMVKVSAGPGRKRTPASEKSSGSPTVAASVEN